LKENAANAELARSYIRVLLLNFHKFFSKDCVLNSDGRRLLNDIAREVAKHRPNLLKLVRKVRKDPTLEHVLKLAREFFSAGEISELISLGVYGAASTYRCPRGSEQEHL